MNSIEKGGDKGGNEGMEGGTEEGKRKGKRTEGSGTREDDNHKRQIKDYKRT